MNAVALRSFAPRIRQYGVPCVSGAHLLKHHSRRFSAIAAWTNHTMFQAGRRGNGLRRFSTPAPRHPPRHHQQQQPGPREEDDLWLLYGTFVFRGILAIGVIHCFSEYCAEITLCEGPSMHPTLQPYGEIVLIDKFTLRRFHGRGGDDPGLCQGQERIRAALERQAAYEKQQQQQQAQPHMEEWHEPRISVSDVMLTMSPWSALWQLLTTPLSVGDVVVLQHPTRSKGTVCKRVLGLPGDIVLRPQQRRQGLLVVPDGHLWVEGDNPANSSDSRSYGAVPMALLQGRVVCRLWPLRGQAVMVRGAPPRQPTHGSMGNSTVLPAGYEGQHIVKSPAVLLHQKKQQQQQPSDYEAEKKKS